MRLPLSDLRRVRWWQVGLTACVLGAIATPLGYIAMGASANFAPMLSIVGLPLVIASIVLALHLSLREPRPLQRSLLLSFALAIAMAIITVFIYVVSNFTLLQPRERLGVLASVFLVMTLCAVPLVVWRRGALLSRIVGMPKPLSAALLAVILLAALTAAALYATGAPAFI
jgi:hypothetical protein